MYSAECGVREKDLAINRSKQETEENAPAAAAKVK